MSAKLSCIIVDDEPLARRGIENLIAEIPFLHLMVSCANPVQAMKALEEHKADLMFLDVQMPKMTGIEFLRTLKNPPITIITTAYQNYALEGYELDVTDYLIKPISLERFAKAVNKARDFFMLRAAGSERLHIAEDYFFIKCGSRYEKVAYDDVLFVEALQNYVVIQTKTKRLITYLTFKGVEEYLPAAQFLKVQKSYIVSLPKIEKIESGEIKIGAHSIPISRQSKDEVMNAILGNRLMKR
jgi:DNA-binding LytR/AlgR family response regulator